METPMDIGTTKQLFLNSALCASGNGVQMRQGVLQPCSEPVVTLDTAYEQALPDARIGGYCSVLKHEGKVKLWWYYQCGPPEDMSARRICYAESADGLHFEKPELHLVDMGGTTANNAVIAEPIQGATVWMDPNAPPEARFRTQAKVGPFPETQTKLRFHASPDGIHWEQTHETRVGACDTQNIVFWDNRYGRYVMYTREWVRFDDPNLSYRQVRRLESDDLVEWSDESIVWEADQRDLDCRETSTGQPPVDYYGAGVYKYPGSKDLYVMFAQAFWHWFDRSPDEKWGYSPDPAAMSKKVVHLGPSTMDVQLGYSIDGKTFQRAPERRPFLNTGPAGRFDSKRAWVLPNPIEMDDEIWVYYSGTNVDHDGFVDPAAGRVKTGIGRAAMRLDGYVAACADDRGGRLTTPLLVFDGTHLELNCDISGGGSIHVELLDEEDKPIPGFTKEDCRMVTGNSVRMPVRWAEGSRPGRLAGTPVKLRFWMQDCALYAFQFR